MDTTISNTAGLKLEIARLKQKREDQELVIKQHFKSPKAIFGTLKSIFYKPSVTDELTAPNNWAGKDITAWLSKLLLPITLNKTLFRKSNFIVKALVRLASQKASTFVNDKNVQTFWDKAKTVLPNAILEKFEPKKKTSLFNLLPPAKKLEKKAV
jgi:hypothetical protein